MDWPRGPPERARTGLDETGLNEAGLDEEGLDGWGTQGERERRSMTTWRENE
jgi:hypothetical protein